MSVDKRKDEEQVVDRKLLMAAVFIGSFLLFQVQPLIGKYLLPWFGGVPAVWTVCLLFFQMVLLGGYGYAHLLQRLPSARQGLVHMAMLLLALLVGGVLCIKWGSPILPDEALRPTRGSVPAARILLLLSISIGLAYFLLSTGTSLMQAWYHRTRSNASPWFFYVLSNVAALLALLSYPFVFEPLLSIRLQAWLWAGGFVVYAGLCMRCAWLIRGAPAVADTAASVDAPPAPKMRDYLLWTTLAACGVLVLMSVTNQMTQDVPPVPFLWVLALALYLLTYIIGFTERWKRLGDLSFVMLLLGGAVAWALLQFYGEFSLALQVGGYSFVLFAFCLYCHHALYRSRPHPTYLTGFYLCLSLGGVLGGLFVALAAPRLFNGYWEYPLALALVTLLAVGLLYRSKASCFYRLRHAAWVLVVLLSVGVGASAFKDAREAVHQSRNFFGVTRVVQFESGGQVASILFHGQTQHGAQYNDDPLRYHPTAYYTVESGIGQLLSRHPHTYRSNPKPLRVGVVGLGIGTLAAYGREGDQYRMYEINPQVIDLALNSPYFSYLKDTDASLEIVEGDARIQLEQELKTSGSQEFDILVLDAFSSDSVPVHLLTREAFALYLQHLAGGGVIAVHVSNKYLNLVPLIRTLEEEFRLQEVMVRRTDPSQIGLRSTWLILMEQRNGMLPIRWADRYSSAPYKPVRIWTDEYSTLLSLFH